MVMVIISEWTEFKKDCHLKDVQGIEWKIHATSVLSELFTFFLTFKSKLVFPFRN